MRAGSRTVVLLAALAALALLAFLAYGGRATRRAGPDTPAAAARDFARADNTVVGLLGGVRAVQPILDERPAPRRASIVATVVGARDSGRLWADLTRAEDRWRVERAAFAVTGGDPLVLAGDGPPHLPAAP